MATGTDIFAGLARLLNDLDQCAQSQEAERRASQAYSNARRHPRYAFRTDCLLRLFPEGFGEPMELKARSRNISRGGIALLVRRVILPGEPIEVTVNRPDSSTLFIAGVVRFCRYAGRGFHEIGIAMKAAGNAPVLPRRPGSAKEMLAWLQSLSTQSAQSDSPESPS